MGHLTLKLFIGNRVSTTSAPGLKPSQYPFPGRMI